LFPHRVAQGYTLFANYGGDDINEIRCEDDFNEARNTLRYKLIIHIKQNVEAAGEEKK